MFPTAPNMEQVGHHERRPLQASLKPYFNNQVILLQGWKREFLQHFQHKLQTL